MVIGICCGVGVDEDGKSAEWARKIRRDLQTEDDQRILRNIKRLRERIESEVAEEASRQAKVEKAASRARGAGASSQTPLQWLVLPRTPLCIFDETLPGVPERLEKMLLRLYHNRLELLQEGADRTLRQTRCKLALA